MPPQSRHKGESKQGLVITLVFFILTTIGLGVAVYFGFAEQDKKDQEVDKAKKAGDVFKADRDRYKFMHAMYRSYMGEGKALPNVENLGTSKTQFDQGTLKLGEDDTKLLKELEKRFGWNGNQPKATFQDEIDKWKKDYEALEKRNQGLQSALAESKEKQQKAEEGWKTAQEDFTKQLATLKKKGDDDQKQAKTDLDKFRTDV